MEVCLQIRQSARAGLRVHRWRIDKALASDVSGIPCRSSDPLTVYQDERVQHGKRQPVCVLEKRLEGRVCGQSTTKCEARVGEWILFIKDRFIAGQVAPDLGTRDSSRDAPEE